MPIHVTILRNLRTKSVIIMSFMALYIIATYVAFEYYVFSKNKVNYTRGPNLSIEYVVVHIDLKGAPPRLDYLKSMLPMLRNHGVNALLIEYEDMFPYEGRLRRLKSVDCYNKNELQDYLATAVSSGFEIIPLVQTFGHLEFALKQPTFAHMRENPKFTDSICPSSLHSQKFIREMLKQQIHFHQSVAPLKHIHVGCDEVSHVNNCSLCQKRNLTKVTALTSHVNFIINTVHDISANLTVLIWDDMFRAVKPLHLFNITFPKTDAVYWDYTSNEHEDTHISMYKYSRMFDNLWIATAFKGADGPDRLLPDLHTRFYNHLYWLNFALDYSSVKKLYKIKGIILTGWSRYRHSSPLCELLPASIPSLILNLNLIENYRKGIVVRDEKIDTYIDDHIRSSLQSSLKCKSLSELPELFDARHCKFDESDLYVALQNLNNRTLTVDIIVKENAYKHSKHMSGNTYNKEPQIEYDYVVDLNEEKEMCAVILHELFIIRDEFIGLLSVYYENYVIQEFISSKIRSLADTIKSLLDFFDHKESERLRYLQRRNKTV